MSIRLRDHLGFTLIELLVTASIIVTLTVLAIASYGNFNKKSVLRQTALTLKNNLRLAQSNINSGAKPEHCSNYKLTGYSVTFNTSSYTIEPICPGVSPAPSPYLSVKLPPNVIIPTPIPSPIIFNVLSKGTNISVKQDIKLSSGTNTYTIQVRNSGDIIDVGVTTLIQFNINTPTPTGEAYE